MSDTTSTVKHVIFDWNGTLLDDLGLAVSCVNRVTTKHLAKATDADIYRSNFQFPIQNFYESLGFDFESMAYEQLMHEYLSCFDVEVLDCGLHENAIDLLANLKVKGVGVSVLSASEQNTLINCLQHFDVHPFFDFCFGLSCGAARGKIARAQDLQTLLNETSENILYVGDTLHDAEVAAEMNWRAVLFSGGHQNKGRLHATGFPVVDDLRDIISFV